MSKRIDQIVQMLKGIETGDPHAVDVISPEQYIQHNPQTQTGRAGLAALFARLSKTNPRVNVVRAFEDGDYVFGHTEYDFDTRRIGFEVFRFEGEHVVEHWDNIQPRQGPNASGHTMVDGPVSVIDTTVTETNRSVVVACIEQVWIDRKHAMADQFIDRHYLEHHPEGADGIDALRHQLAAHSDESESYLKLHRVLAQGEFVLSVTEGTRSNTRTAYYDLFRLDAGMITERWNTTEAVAPRDEWRHDNGKF
ncbi:MAG: nuclear transport factor 2 family protein [Pseudomonadota bacterium]